VSSTSTAVRSARVLSLAVLVACGSGQNAQSPDGGPKSEAGSEAGAPRPEGGAGAEGGCTSTTCDAGNNDTGTPPDGSGIFTPTLVQHVSGSNTRGNDFTSPYCYYYQLPGGTTAGNAVVVGFTFNGNPTPTVTDDEKNGYSIVENYFDSVDMQSIAIAAAFGVKAGARVISLCFDADPGGYVQPMATEFENVVAADGAGAGNSGSGTSATSGSLTPSVGADLVYQVVASLSVKQSSFTAGHLGLDSARLLSADLMDGFAGQYGINNSAGAITPAMTLGSSDKWVSAAVSLKAGSAGSVPSGMRIVHLVHENVPYNVPAGGTGNPFPNPLSLQFPTSGNLLVAMVGGGNMPETVTGMTDSNHNHWSQAGETYTGGDAVAQAFYAPSAASSEDLGLQVSWSGTMGDYTFFLYDVLGAAASSPLDTTAGGSGNQGTAGNLTMPFTITPAAAGEIVFSEVMWDYNTGSGLVGQLFDTNTFTGESESGPEPVDENNGWGHTITTSTAPVAFTWTLLFDGLPTGAFAGMAAAFKAGP
jgi:hypothetical protein